MKVKKIISFLLCVILVSKTFSVVTLAAENNPFTDVKTSDWFYDGVQYAYEHSIMNGTGNGKFSPDETTTRGMIVTILHRLEGTPSVKDTAFSDVSKGKWYFEAANWASSKGIVNGYGNGKFGPEDTITREQMAAILYRYANYKGYDVSESTGLSKYADSAQISSYAVESMAWANATGLITGTTSTTLSPKGSATRAQAAVILMRFLEKNQATLTIDDLKNYFDTTNEIKKVAEKYTDENGFVSENEVADLENGVIDKIQTLISEKKILDYSVEKSNIWMELSSGIQYVYIFPIEGTSGSGNTGNLSIITYEPFSNWWEAVRPSTSQGINGEAATDGVARKMEAAFGNYSFIHNYDDNAVTLDAVRELGDNQIVLWDSHGGFTANSHSFIAIGEQLDEVAFLLNPVYYLQKLNYTADYLSGTIICTSIDNRIAIGNKFIEKYVSSMNNSFVYLGACETGKDSVFADSFLGKGAAAVVANSETVLTDYTQAMEREICLKMLEINPQTNQYYTLSEALAYAKRMHGRTDGSKWNSEVLIFGGAKAYNFRLADLENTDSKINYYKVFTESVSSWEGAELYCESLGGHLATLTSKEENDHVYQMMRNAGYTSAYFGLTDKDVEGTWTWVTGEPVVYTNWHSGEPNHENANEDYAMFYYKYSDGTWNDGDFGRKTAGAVAFICEWDTEEAYKAYLKLKNTAYSYSDLIDKLKDNYGTASSEQFVSSMGPSHENFPNEITGYISSEEVDLNSDGTKELVVFRSISGADAVEFGAQTSRPHILVEVYQKKDNQAELRTSKLIGEILYCEGSNCYLFYSKQLGSYCIIYDYGTWGSFTGLNSNGAVAYTISPNAINQVGDWSSTATNLWEGDDIEAELLSIGAPYAEYGATIDRRSSDASFIMMAQVIHDVFGISPEEAAKYNNGRCLAHTLQIVGNR